MNTTYRNINYKEKVKELQKAFEDIFSYWSTTAYNNERKQFYGFIDHFGSIKQDAELGIIMYSRILWAFSAAAIFTKNKQYEVIATETINFLNNHFLDDENGGYFWEISVDRKPTITKKQTYAQAFVIYSMCEYYAFTKDEKALQSAMKLFQLIEQHCYDPEYGGYFEAYTKDWTMLDDVRLSLLDRNDPKSMNTNLHVLEAYTRLYSLTKDIQVKDALIRLCEIFKTRIIDSKGHLKLFFDTQWNSQVNEYSYGHDIETSWLLWDAIETLDIEECKAEYRSVILQMADVFLNEAVDDKGNSCVYHKYLDSGKFNTERHWWVLCEALEGLANAYELTGDEKYRTPIIPFWDYIAQNIIDSKNGEWHWGVYEDGTAIEKEPKVSNWKAPYHNGRALIRVIEKMKKWKLADNSDIRFKV